MPFNLYLMIPRFKKKARVKRMKRATAAALCALALMIFPLCAIAQYDAQMAESWLARLSAEIAHMEPMNDVLATADPARAGEYLLEFPFGTLIASNPQSPAAGEILRVELTSGDVTDSRGLCVGQTLEDVIAGRELGASETPLYVLSTQDTGYGWSWAYLGEGGVYGVEYITYGGDELAMKEYTLTYVIAEDTITAIRMQIADATLSQAEEGLLTAEEIAGRQRGEILAVENAQDAFDEADMAIAYRRAVGVPVEELIAIIGEPQEIQVLPSGDGRLLVYAMCAAQLWFDELTGVERVRSVSCVEAGVTGPRGLTVGMTIQEAAALFRCDGSVYSTGGALYLAGEAQGVAPYGELIAGDAGQYTLRYACVTAEGETGVLDIGISDGMVTHWNLHIEAAEETYGG